MPRRGLVAQALDEDGGSARRLLAEDGGELQLSLELDDALVGELFLLALRQELVSVELWDEVRESDAVHDFSLQALEDAAASATHRIHESCCSHKKPARRHLVGNSPGNGEDFPYDVIGALIG